MWMQMIVPYTMSRDLQPAILPQHAARLAEVGAEVPDVLEHLERGHQVVLAVGAVERAVVADAHLVRGVDVRAAVARAGGGEPGLIGPRAARSEERRVGKGCG